MRVTLARVSGARAPVDAVILGWHLWDKTSNPAI